MGRMTRAECADAQQRRLAVRLYRARVPVKTIAQKCARKGCQGKWISGRIGAVCTCPTGGSSWNMLLK
jgi:hypothetical protein